MKYHYRHDNHWQNKILNIHNFLSKNRRNQFQYDKTIKKSYLEIKINIRYLFSIFFDIWKNDY